GRAGSASRGSARRRSSRSMPWARRPGARRPRLLSRPPVRLSPPSDLTVRKAADPDGTDFRRTPPQMKKHVMTRRQFLGTTAAAAAGAALWNGLILGDEAKGANEKLAVASIGVSGRGWDDLSETAAAGVEIVALCDVDETRATAARRHFPRAAFSKDFR